MMNLYGQGKAVVLMPSAINGFAALGGTAGPERQGAHRLRAEPGRPVGQADPELLDLLGRRQQVLQEQGRRLQGARLHDRQAVDGGLRRADRLAVHHLPRDHARAGAAGKVAEGRRSTRSRPPTSDADPHYFPYIPELNEFMDRIGTSASEAISGAATVDEALANLQAWAEDRMTKAGYYK